MLQLERTSPDSTGRRGVDRFYRYTREPAEGAGRSADGTLRIPEAENPPL
jgi:hypothetical protein